MRKFFKLFLGQQADASEFPPPDYSEVQAEEASTVANNLPDDPVSFETGVTEKAKEPSETAMDSGVNFEPQTYLSEYQYPDLDLADEKLIPVFTALKEVSCTLPIIWSVSTTDVQVRDLANLQCLLIAGAPGCGKSNLLHQLILTLLYKKHPSQLKFVLMDYKGLDLPVYNAIEKHFLAKLPGNHAPVISDTTLATHTLNSLCIEMDNRYDLLRAASVKDIASYNEKFIQRLLAPTKGHQYLPALVLVADNIEGFITRNEKEMSLALQRLVTMGYKAGIYVVLTTSDLHYKSIPTELVRLIGERIALRLNSKEEYRKLFETTSVSLAYERGAFHYLYQGRVLDGTSAYVSTEMIKSVVQFISVQKGYPDFFLLPAYIDEQSAVETDFETYDYDSLLADAALLVVQNQIGSTSLIQRRMKLGYNRAGRLMSQLEATGIVGPEAGSKARDVLIKTEQQLQYHLSALGIS